MTMVRRPPAAIDGTPVYVISDDELIFGGERWITLAPQLTETLDDRMWEFSLDSGRIVRTQ